MPVLGGTAGGGSTGQRQFQAAVQPGQPQPKTVLIVPVTAATVAAATAGGSIDIGGTATATGDGAAVSSITIGGTATATAPETATGTVTIGGTPTAQAPAAGSGGIVIGGTPSAAAPDSSVGTVNIGGTPAATASVTAAGGITLGGTGAPDLPPPGALGSIDLDGIANGVSADPVTVEPGRFGQAAPYGHWQFPQPNPVKKKRREEELLLLLSEV